MGFDAYVADSRETLTAVAGASSVPAVGLLGGSTTDVPGVVSVAEAQDVGIGANCPLGMRAENRLREGTLVVHQVATW